MVWVGVGGVWGMGSGGGEGDELCKVLSSEVQDGLGVWWGLFWGFREG